MTLHKANVEQNDLHSILTSKKSNIEHRIIIEEIDVSSISEPSPIELNLNDLDIVFAENLTDEHESFDNEVAQISNEVIQNNEIVDLIPDLNKINNKNVSPDKIGKR